MSRNILPTNLERKYLINNQQMEVVVNGSNGATHLVLCTGIANLSSCNHETLTFLVGLSLSRRQLIGVIASGALPTIELDAGSNADDPEIKVGARLLAITVHHDQESGQVKVSAEVISSVAQ